MGRARIAALLLALLVVADRAAAQAWNSDSAVALARRAMLRRERAAEDTSLRDYKAQAHGFLFFLGQFGAGLTEPPRLVKADQLELEVYWKAPGLSKQRIVGWRERAELPTDINYHRDHLGIIQNNFGRTVRLGEGDEVRDVPHPLAPAGLALYDFRLGDTVTIELPPPQRVVRVVELHVRPKQFDEPRLVGTLFVDAAGGDLVRLAFTFTPRAYLDPQLEDVSIVLDNALWEGRHWLPYRQEIEIRRRATWLDMPARGIIRGRWAIDGYVFNVGLVDRWFAGEEITAVPQAERDSFPWRVPLSTALRELGGPPRVGADEVEAARADVARIAGRHVMTGLKSRRLGARRVSDLLRFNRVEGLAAGAGVVWRAPLRGIETRVLASYGFADHQVKGLLAVSSSDGLELAGYREVRDIADEPVIAPLLNSFAAQEFGDDYGDYYRATGVRLSRRRPLGRGGRGAWELGAARERVASLEVRAAPAGGRFRPNPQVRDGDYFTVTVAARRRGDVSAELALEAGRADHGPSYVRASGGAQVTAPLGSTRFVVRARAGVAGAGLPPHRAFVLGGRGTLLGDPFRAWGGRRAALLHAEWRVPVPFVRMAAGPYARTPGTITLITYAAAGWTDRPVSGTGWLPTPDARVTLGTGVEWLGVVRLEAGYGLQSRRVGVAFDISRAFWDIL